MRDRRVESCEDSAMQRLHFNSNKQHTLGIELELGLVDARTLELSSTIHRVLEALDGSQQVFKPELMQCCIEINTGICQTVQEAEEDLRGKVIQVEQVADSLGLKLWWGATHPFSLWKEQRITPNQRYYDLVALLQEMARRLVTFGLHVHVGVDSGDKAVMICDRMMRHLPTLLALTCSSPFWESRNTGLHSHRSKIMEGLPTAGLPTLMRNWSEYVWLVTHMVDTGFINTVREIWWDIRPHHSFGTVEVRVCDMPGNLDDVLSIAALVQCLIKALSDNIDQGTYQHDCHPMMVQQNKWRACRFGREASLVDSYSFSVQSVSEVATTLVQRLAPHARQLDCERYLRQVVEMAHTPSWSRIQLQLLEETNDSAEVVRRLCERSRLSAPPQ
jgi:glutamate---cysteine ligase / carboxylate-amine ligase